MNKDINIPSDVQLVDEDILSFEYIEQLKVDMINHLSIPKSLMFGFVPYDYEHIDIPKINLSWLQPIFIDTENLYSYRFKRKHKLRFKNKRRDSKKYDMIAIKTKHINKYRNIVSNPYGICPITVQA